MVSKAQEQAATFLTAAKEYGFRVSVKGNDVVTISATFEPGDNAAYIRYDSDQYDVLSMVPTVAPGSTWGTDSASVGGAVGLAGGYYRMNISGVSKRFAGAVAKMIAS